MRYCTECRAEYEEGVEQCADCDLPLIGQDEWRGMMARESAERETLGEMIRLRVLESPFERDVLVEALERGGIPYLVREFQDTAYGGLYVPSLGWGEIEVPEADLERARALWHWCSKQLRKRAEPESGGPGEAESGPGSKGEKEEGEGT